MDEIAIQEKMYQMATEFISKRYPTGWGGASVMRTSDDQYLTSVAMDTLGSNVELCIEVGAMCEATKHNLKITHSICVVRDDERSNFKVLTPCGVCQERLRYWGVDVKVAVTTKDNTLKFVTINELQPHHWTNAFSDIEFYDDKNKK